MKWIVEFAQIVLIQIFCNILRLRLFKIIVEVFNGDRFFGFESREPFGLPGCLALVHTKNFEHFFIELFSAAYSEYSCLRTVRMACTVYECFLLRNVFFPAHFLTLFTPN